MLYDNVLVSTNLGSSRDVFLEFNAPEVGRYLFVPCTEKGYHSAEYLLRVFSNSNVNFRYCNFFSITVIYLFKTNNNREYYTGNMN